MNGKNYPFDTKNIHLSGLVGRVPAFQPGAQVRFPAGSGILISVLGFGVCPLSVFCPVLSSAKALTSADHTFREARPCVSV